jgi:hypothetical protein
MRTSPYHLRQVWLVEISATNRSSNTRTLQIQAVPMHRYQDDVHSEAQSDQCRVFDIRHAWSKDEDALHF